MGTRGRRLACAGVALALIGAVGACDTGSGERATSEDVGAGGDATAIPAGDDRTVARVVDGDTIVLDDDVRVRLIGIDTPETKDPRRPVECFGQEASAHMIKLLPAGTRVRVVYDVERTDRYGRTLAYLYRASDGLFVNAAMVRDGFASAYTVPPNVAHADEFVALNREARETGRGLWSACDAA
ncbi:MAG TPA: thermonuclease family protein [Acidimicrobiia bacterium]|nr:thermonuclease family protein [Acidimicrobiia bacterium]